MEKLTDTEIMHLSAAIILACDKSPTVQQEALLKKYARGVLRKEGLLEGANLTSGSLNFVRVNSMCVRVHTLVCVWVRAKKRAHAAHHPGLAQEDTSNHGGAGYDSMHSGFVSESEFLLFSSRVHSEFLSLMLNK